MLNLKTLSFLKWGTILFFAVSILINALSGLVVGLQEENWTPLAENTIGLLLSGDNLALQMEQDIVEGRLDQFPEEYQDEIRKAFFQTIFLNIFATIVMLILLFKMWSWLFGIKSMESGIDVVSVVLSVATYAVLGIIYTILIESAKSGALTIKFSTLLSAIPIKALYYGIVHFPDLIGFL